MEAKKKKRKKRGERKIKRETMPKKMLKADYIEVIESHFAEQGKRLTNLSKATVYDLKEIIEKYDIDYDEKAIISANDELKVKQKNFKNIYNNTEILVTKEVKEDKDLSDYKVGEVVIYYTKYQVNGRDTNINVKCKIVKINKQSLTLQHYDCDIDESDVNRALREQTYGVRIFKWHSWHSPINKKCVCKNVEKLIRKGDCLYNDYVKQTTTSVDFGF